MAQNPYQNYDKTPVLWLVGSCIGYGLVTIGSLIEPNPNLAGAGCITLGVCVPLTIVKYVKHERFICYKENQHE